MVEPAAREIYRGLTPKPHKRKDEDPPEAERGVEDSSALHAHPFESDLDGAEDSRVDDSGGGGFRPKLMQGDARGSMGDSSTSPDQGRRTENRRQSSSQQSSSRRHHGPQPPLQTNFPSQSSRDTMGSPTVQASPTHYPPQASYNQRQGFVGQYTVPAQPPVGMSHTPQSFPYSLPYSHSGGADASLIPQNIHATYQPLLQPAIYPYQRSSDAGSPAFPSPPVFPHQVNPATPPVSPMSPPSSSPVHSPYSGSGPFHSLPYQQPLTSPPFAFPQTFVPSPLYQSQYPPVHYQQPFTSTQETEGPGTWWYLPHGSSLPGQAATPPYQGHFPGNYQEADATYVQPQTPPHPSHSSVHPMSPGRHRHDPNDTRSSSGVNISSSSPPPGSTSSGGAQPERTVVRRSYHPNPPAHRSEWVMWVGNVPSDASHDELWRFFVSVPGKPSENAASLGVISIFLISRSNCAFVNFEDEADLSTAITRFNGQPLRPNDPRCPRLLCRMRKKDDDLKAGVGGQRGMGMHTKWVKGKKAAKMRSDVSAEQSDGDDLSSYATASSSSGRHSHETPPASHSSDDEGRPPPRNKDSSSSGSFASTNSSMLARYFPSRYFILKSLNQYDVDLSVKEGLWATQRHNEGILDQAYRTSKEVYLIFGVNKSGEFYGYAKMAGPVRQGGQRVSWAQRTDSSASSRSSLSPVAGRGSLQSETIPEDGPSRFKTHPRSPFTDHLVDESPMGVSDIGTPGRQGEVLTAPAEMQEQHRRLSLQTQRAKFSLDQPRGAPVDLTRHSKSQARIETAEFHLDENAPIRAAKSSDSPKSGRYDARPLLASTAEQEWKTGRVEEEDPKALETWGEPFRIEWISTERLPFYRCRHIRNPWNHDREVKVSRDGTELEPSVGQMLIEEWEKMDGGQEESDVVPETGSTRSGKSGGNGGGSGNGAPRGSSRTKSLQAAKDLRETSSA